MIEFHDLANIVNQKEYKRALQENVDNMYSVFFNEALTNNCKWALHHKLDEYQIAYKTNIMISLSENNTQLFTILFFVDKECHKKFDMLSASIKIASKDTPELSIQDSRVYELATKIFGIDIGKRVVCLHGGDF